MEYKRYDDSIVLRIEAGEDVYESVLALAQSEKIELAEVSGIGATNDFTVGVYDIGRGEYDCIHFEGDHEITSLSGNVSTMNGQAYVHLHINCANAKAQIVGGHLFSARVSLTCEVFIRVVKGRAERERDERLGINLMHMKDADK